MAKLEATISGSPESSQTDISGPGSVDAKRGTAWAAQGLKTDRYRPVDSYEGIHRYDPEFEWKPEEEKRIVRKVRCPFCAAHCTALTSTRSTSAYARSFA
jgi:hypothetical protein